VKKTIDSINGLTVNHPTDPYHIMEKMQMALMVTHTHLTLQNSWLALPCINVFPQKTLTWGQLFSSLLLWNSILFYYYVVSINVSKIQFSLTAGSSMIL
jgi:hypothetical protein